MGLDIAAYSKVFREEDRPDLVRLQALGIFQLDHVLTIQHEGPFQFSIEQGKYWRGPDSVEKEWRVGSYSGYNSFKRELAGLFGWNGDGPFGLLFRSDDSTAVFGTAACRELLAAFEQGLSEAERYFHQGEDQHGDFIRVYTQLLDSFRLGADEGVVYFC
jgi:hypothetical protein